MIGEEIARLEVDPARARVYEHGWQSWSPTDTYSVNATSCRPVRAHGAVQHYRPGKPPPPEGFQAEGLLVVDTGLGETVCFGAQSCVDIPSIAARLDGEELIVAADGPVSRDDAPDIDSALENFGDRFARLAVAEAVGPAPTAWCSWYHYFTEVTEADVVENLNAVDAADLPVDVVQIDDGWQEAVGDWLTLSDRFESLRGIVKRINGSGRRAGIWVAPFLAVESSRLAREHPEWLLPDRAGHNWGEDTRGVDPLAAADYLTEVFTMLCEAGFDYFKLDFLYAGAMEDVDAYREGLRHIRRVVGEDAYLLGCGAPILPSVGLFDAMRIGPDIAVRYEPRDGDPSQPSQRGAAMNTVSRAWQHGRFWVNDPDCLVARPEIEHREDWAAVVERYGGLRSSSDRIAALDEWGMAATRRVLSTVPDPVPFAR
ncbi:MAG: glycoside hydrolase family 36 protein [Stackebrandtia sp.]